MKTLKTLLLSFALVSMIFIGTSFGAFPKKPIKLIVYTKPGGAIDVFARKFQKIAKKYTDTTFVVVNKTGAGGVVAMKHVLSKKADGYMLAAVTRSNIGKMVSSKSNLKVDQFNWMAMMVSDPEAVITNKNQAVNTWEQLVADAKAKNGKQLWVGPAAGGNDHIMALKTWQKAGIKAKWIPYGSGGKAMAALMGGHGIAYVGNPGDVIGKPDLKVAAISSPQRLTGKFANVPTFDELGIKNHDSEIMWRGFMTKQGIPAEAQSFYDDLFAKMDADADWQGYIKNLGANPVFYNHSKFTEIVKMDREVFTKTLREIGAIK
jgi:putative tricarboxylic transport membrane protein